MIESVRLVADHTSILTAEHPASDYGEHNNSRELVAKFCQEHVTPILHHGMNDVMMIGALPDRSSVGKVHILYESEERATRKNR